MFLLEDEPEDVAARGFTVTECPPARTLAYALKHGYPCRKFLLAVTYVPALSGLTDEEILQGATEILRALRDVDPWKSHLGLPEYYKLFWKVGTLFCLYLVQQTVHAHLHCTFLVAGFSHVERIAM